MNEILDRMVDLRTRNAPFALATVIEVEGSASAKTGAKALIGGDGRVLAGWVGGGCAESTVCSTALSSSNAAPEAAATMRASVVLPEPGGPWRIIECGCPVSIACLSVDPSASSCSWPTNSSSACGRMRVDSGTRAGSAMLAPDGPWPDGP